MVCPNKVARVLGAASALLVLSFSPLAAADPWLPPGNLSLRHDIQLLADAQIIRAPVTTWPMSWPDIARDVVNANIPEPVDPQITAALMRVRHEAEAAARMGMSDRSSTLAGAEKPTLLRTFADTPRETATVGAGASWLGGRWSARLSATAVTDPDDDQRYRLDGSYLGLTLGNFMISAGSMDRWWGPGWEGSLILSTNARPIPSLTIERKHADAFEWKLLRWLGPWRASISMGQMEGSDVAVPDARLFAARVNFRPRPWLEFGLSRTAQWCGDGRPCDFNTFSDLLIGRDNRSDSLTVEEEPGNQMAGYDMRVRSPWRAIPAAVYTQLIGEDEAGGLPSRLLGLAGVEMWTGSRWGSLRAHIEYADTACNFSRQRPLFGCAYRNSLYPQGYTYRGRSIGHALEGDGRMYSFGAMLVRDGGESWSLLLRKAELNRDEVSVEPAHTVSPSRNALRNVELQYNRAFARGELGVGLGLDDYTGPLRDDSDVRGFVQWRQGF